MHGIDVKKIVEDQMARNKIREQRELEALAFIYGDKFRTEGMAHYRRLKEENEIISNEQFSRRDKVNGV